MSAVALALLAMAPHVEVDRAVEIAADIDAAAVEAPADLGASRMSAALISVLIGESGLRRDVETCKITGDGGRSIGLGQVMIGANWGGYTRREICASRALQVRLAAGVLRRCWERTPRLDSMMRCYASGDAAVRSDAAKAHVHRAQRAWRIMRPVGAS